LRHDGRSDAPFPNPLPHLRERGDPPPAGPISLSRVFTAFLWIGCTSFGGGTAGWLYREIVLKRRWVDDAT
jgi:hypothetical protein